MNISQGNLLVVPTELLFNSCCAASHGTQTAFLLDELTEQMLQCFEVKGIEASGSDSARAVAAWTPPQQTGARKFRLFSRLSEPPKPLQKQSFTPLSSGISAAGAAAPGDLLLQKRMSTNSWKSPHPENIWMFSSQYWWQAL